MASTLLALRMAVRRSRVRAGHGVRIGRGARFEVAPGAHVVLGDDCELGQRARVLVRAGRVEVGAGTVIGERATIVALASVTIGAGCVLGAEVVIIDFDHVFDDVERPIRAQSLRSAPVAIGDAARIGMAASILSGVAVGAGARVAPRSVVTRDVPAGATVEGIPARPVGAPRAGRA